jgi:MbtH protein
LGWDEEEDKQAYKVIKDSRNQYKIWSVKKKTPAGWVDTGKQGLKKECLDYIEEVWTDRTKVSLRKR